MNRPSSDSSSVLPPQRSPRTVLHLFRVVCVGLAIVGALAIGSATDGRSAAADTVATIAWGLVVAAVALSVVVPAPLGLAVVRLLVPASVPAMVAALLLGASSTIGVAAVALAVVASALALAAETGEAMVQAAAYGAERRLPLRTPAPLLLPATVAWLLWCALAVGGVLALCATNWVLGAVLVLLAAALGRLVLRRTHQLTRRWLVIVPAGVVVHDQLVLAETLMVPTSNVRLARLALAGTEAADLTGPAAGHAVEITVGEMVLALFPATAEQPKGRALHVQSFLVAPSRPGRALRALADGKVPVG